MEQEFVIPRESARAFQVKEGEVMRVTDIEGQQVGDMIIFNANDYREKFCSWLTTALNKSVRHFKELYSVPPRGNKLFTILEDKVGIHWAGGRCNRTTYERLCNVKGHRSCQDQLAESVKPFGISEFDLGDVFNIFMNVVVHPDATRTIEKPTSKAGDYIDLKVEMDLLVAISACPDNMLPVNNFKTKPLRVTIRK